MKSGAYLAEMNSKWPKLQELYKVLFGHSFEGAHNAMADVVATKRLFLGNGKASENIVVIFFEK